MLSVAHGTTGAFLATKIPNPLISLPLAIGFHFLEDYIPHWDVGQGLTKKLKSTKAAFLQELFFDLPISLAIVYFFFQYQKEFSIWPWIGWFAALLPDYIEAPKHIFRFEPPIIKQINHFHHSHHHSIPHKFRGLIPQIAIILIIYLLR